MRPFSVQSLADRWGVKPPMLYGLIKGGELTSFKVGGKLLRISFDEVERWENGSNSIEELGASSGEKTGKQSDAHLVRQISPKPRGNLRVIEGSNQTEQATE